MLAETYLLYSRTYICTHNTFLSYIAERYQKTNTQNVRILFLVTGKSLVV